MIGFNSAFSFFTIVSIIYLLLFVFIVVMIYRFVKAHERIADGIMHINKHLRDKGEHTQL